MPVDGDRSSPGRLQEERRRRLASCRILRIFQLSYEEDGRVPLKVTFELSDADLRHFRKVMREARSRAKHSDEQALLASARQLLAHVKKAQVPHFVRTRLAQLETMIAMLEDSEWDLKGVDRDRVTSALAYFDEPLDLIPDHVPGFGFLDDAVMVELVVRELKHDIEAFEDFCSYRRIEEKQRGKESDVTRAEWLGAKRRQLHSRMRRRRQRTRRSRTTPGRGRSPFSLW
jgi:uncharacterized membrane protein YkvA (DUF1232 family)